MADRWVTDYVVDARRADVIERAIASHYDSDHYQTTEAEYQEMADSPDLEDAPTENARCVWLPVTFSAEGGAADQMVQPLESRGFLSGFTFLLTSAKKAVVFDVDFQWKYLRLDMGKETCL